MCRNLQLTSPRRGSLVGRVQPQARDMRFIAVDHLDRSHGPPDQSRQRWRVEIGNGAGRPAQAPDRRVGPDPPHTAAQMCCQPEDWGHPIVDDGHRKVLTFVTSAFGSYSGCRQYQEDIGRVIENTQVENLVIDKIRLFWNHPKFLSAVVSRIETTMEDVPLADRPHTKLLFTAHSIPKAWEKTSQKTSSISPSRSASGIKWLGLPRGASADGQRASRAIRTNHRGGAQDPLEPRLRPSAKCHTCSRPNSV